MTIPLAALFPFPRHRRFILSAIRTWTIGVALLLAIAPARVQGQAQPSISVQSAGAGSNLLFQLNTQSNWFYTFQQSANFTNWGYAADYYASNTSLNWTNPIATNGTAAFFRVKVNAPNPAANTNYHSWANSVTINNGLVEAVIVPTIGRVQQFRFLGDTNNAFWEDPTLYGQVLPPTPTRDSVETNLARAGNRHLIMLTYSFSYVLLNQKIGHPGISQMGGRGYEIGREVRRVAFRLPRTHCIHRVCPAPTSTRTPRTISASPSRNSVCASDAAKNFST